MPHVTTCRQEILKAVDAVTARTGRPTFTPAQVVAEMLRIGTRYREATIRTHIVAHLCVNAPRNAAVTYPDFERVAPGLYRRYLLAPGETMPATRHEAAAGSTLPVSKNEALSAAPMGLPKGKVVLRMRQRVDALIAGFSEYLAAFAAGGGFTGPSVYFHLRTLERLRAHASPVHALDYQLYLDSLYATLVSWGMHRMGPGSAKMRSMDEFRQGFERQRSAIALIQRQQLLHLTADEISSVAHHIWSIMDGLTVGEGETKIVAGLKALHHLLPALVPPIDRRYTLRFFYGTTQIYWNQQERIVKTLFPLFHEIALACAEQIADALAHPSCPMDNSVTKVIDNAIMGYCIRELSEPPSTEHPA